MIMRGHHVLMAPEAGDGGGATGGTPAGDGGATGGAATPADTGSGAGTFAGSALAAGAGTQAPGAAGAPAQTPFGAIPEKFHVKNADGTPNLEASWLKVEEHRAHLERRLGAGDLPPKSAADYKVTIPDSLKDTFKAEELGATEKFKGFAEKMHAAGLSQKQFDSAVETMLNYSMGLQKGAQALSERECMAELSKTWATEQERATNLQAAYRAASAYGDIDKLMQRYGNDPEFIRFAAKVGAEVREDSPAGQGAGGTDTSEQEVAALQASPAYWNKTDPQHAIVKSKVDAFYAAKYGDKPKASGSMSFGSVL